MARSDLPRALHIVCTEDSKEQIYDVQLALPGESQVTRIHVSSLGTVRYG